MFRPRIPKAATKKVVKKKAANGKTAEAKKAPNGKEAKQKAKATRVAASQIASAQSWADPVPRYLPMRPGAVEHRAFISGMI